MNQTQLDSKHQKLTKPFKGKKVLVTGGTGLIGRQVVSLLCDAGADVTSVSLDNIRIDDRAKYLTRDLTSFRACDYMIWGMDYVFHLAGIKGSPQITALQPASFFVPMLMINTNVLEACRINKVKGVVFTSSIGAYAPAPKLEERCFLQGEPMDSYPGWAKRMGELQIQAYQIQYKMNNFSIVRLSNTYGPGDNFDPDSAMVIPALMAKIYRGDNPVKIFGDGNQIRDFLYSKDAAIGIIKALLYGGGCGIINLAGKQPHTIADIIFSLNEFIPFNFEFDGTKSEYPIRVMDISKAINLIGFYPKTELKDGLKETWDWYINNADEYKLKKNYFREA